MKIAAISDLHVLPNNEDKELLASIKRRVEEIAPDVFVIAGDISDRIDVLSDSLSQLKVDSCSNLYVAGNHDIWFEDNKSPSSLDKYSKIVGQVCTENGFQHLPDFPHIEGNTAFVGSIGWYDYSFHRPELEIPMEHYEQKEYRGAVWYDLFKIDWGYNDIDATDLFNRKLEYDLSTLPENVTQVVYISHHLPFRELTIYRDRLPWDFHSAFMGAQSTGKILESDPRVILSISGHSHIRNMTTVGKITAITVPLGYGRPDQDKLGSFVSDAIAVIEISKDGISIPDFVKGDICADLPYVASRHKFDSTD
ncbi:MAG: metallophosphoesterase [Candidatus Thorarchaeota archaeon]